MVNKSFLRKSSLLFVLSGLLIWLNVFSKNPQRVYSRYTHGLYPIIKSLLGNFSALTSISYGEIIVGILILLGIMMIVKRLLYFRQVRGVNNSSRSLDLFIGDGLTIINSVLVLSLLFQLLWGMNYHQPRLLDQLNLNAQTVKTDELVTLMLGLSGELEETRSHLLVTNENVVMTNESIGGLLRQAFEDYEEASRVYDFVALPVSLPKPIASSILFSYSGISGIYNPFTGEANVNTLNSSYMLPAVALHEMAHQQGIAKEGEANFMAFLIAENSQSYFSQYSGKLMVLIYGLNNLARLDEEAYCLVYDNLSEGIKNDLRANRETWAKYDGPIEELQERVNDQYLKVNGQMTGVNSYSEVIDLYVAWSKK